MYIIATHKFFGGKLGIWIVFPQLFQSIWPRKMWFWSQKQLFLAIFMLFGNFEIFDPADLHGSSFCPGWSDRSETLGTFPNSCQKYFPNVRGR